MIWATVSSRSGFYWLYRASPPLTAVSISSFNSVQSLSCAQLFVTPWTASPQASLSIINSWSLFKLMSITLLMPSNHLILCHPLLLPPSKTQNQSLFNESVLHIRWPKYCCFSFSISPSNEYSGLISFRMDIISEHNHSDFCFDHLVMSMGSIISSTVGNGCLCDQHVLLTKLLYVALFHFVFQDPIRLLVCIFVDFLIVHSNPLWWKGHFFF